MSPAKSPADLVRDLQRLLGVRAHLEDCPFEDPGVEGARVEGYDLTRSNAPNQPGGVVGVVRCVECGGHRVLDRPLARALDDLAKR